MRSRALTALTRFGLGPRPGEVAAISTDPVGFVLAQCDRPQSALIDAGLLDRETLREQFMELQGALQEASRAVRTGDTTPEEEEAREMAVQDRSQMVQKLRRDEVSARVDHGLTTDNPFVERLVLFWSNHFAIEWRKAVQVRFTIGLFEREAIRRNVLGRFDEMLIASTTHPAMLTYLDNHRSIGPNSRMGQRRNSSINENLARELLELHTVGVGGGYTQEDVIELANTLTGWNGGIMGRRNIPAFQWRWHEPGPRTIMGTHYTTEGEEQLTDVLLGLAHHPATARHIATKFARHFVGDDAPDSLIADLEASFVDTGGDLKALSLTLLESDVAWDAPPVKTVPPYDFMIGSGRAFGISRLPENFVLRSARDLAQDVWAVPSPAGWPDDDRAFLGGDSLLERMDYVLELVRRHTSVRDVPELAHRLLADDLDPFVAEAVERAEDPSQGAVLLLMSPAFQRR
ncbi:DUF1800 domain-containing protein [Acuticoccus sp. M5D2P5]|uniref:DUF1800 domain-containing protein n=1 Tax=Acuticoccus kalidii TaxID=2910977 RepID=UPI001F384081|nr:DUF1800 domain-containing protein [Acuticoccus kalidii]MCF3935822.1 DUF1800 domain-containing protein [Acuticoccus kalidii]